VFPRDEVGFNSQEPLGLKWRVVCERSQFSFETGRSACTSIAGAATMALLQLEGGETALDGGESVTEAFVGALVEAGVASHEGEVCVYSCIVSWW
jgi:hypothetical protein